MRDLSEPNGFTRKSLQSGTVLGPVNGCARSALWCGEGCPPGTKYLPMAAHLSRERETLLYSKNPFGLGCEAFPHSSFSY